MAVSDLCEYGSIMKIKLHQRIPCFEEALARCYFRDVVLGLEYRMCFISKKVIENDLIVVHDLDIIHRDLKTENILLNSSNRAIIGDFSISYTRPSSASVKSSIADIAITTAISSSLMTPLYTPPELLTPSANLDKTLLFVSNEKSIDIWSLGVTLFCFVHGHAPFESIDVPTLYEMILNTNVGSLIHPSLSPEIKSLICRMMDPNPRQRITLAQIKSHPWTSDNGRDKMMSYEENCCARFGSSESSNGAVRTTRAATTISSITNKRVEINDEELRQALKPTVSLWNRVKDRMTPKAQRTNSRHVSQIFSNGLAMPRSTTGSIKASAYMD